MAGRGAWRGWLLKSAEGVSPVPTIPSWFNFALLYGVGLYALCRGPREARLAGVYYAVSCSAITVFMFVRPEYAVVADIPHIKRIDISLEILDVLVFGIIMLQSKHYCTLFACAFSLCEVTTPVAHFGISLIQWAYGTMQLIWIYAMLIVIAWGGRGTSVAKGGAWRLTPRSILAHI
jgi:hypothetical protein